MKKCLQIIFSIGLGLLLVSVWIVVLRPEAKAAGFDFITAYELEAAMAGNHEEPGDEDPEAGGHNRAPGETLPAGESPPGLSPEAVNAIPSGRISYQGRLLEDGAPFHGNIAMAFGLYKDASEGAPLWQEVQTVNVNNGLFSVMLGSVQPLNLTTVDFQHQLWLGIQPSGADQELSPRQPIGAAGYAMSLLPGATIIDSNPVGGYFYSFFLLSDKHPAFYAESITSTGVTGKGSLTGTTGISTDGTGVYGEILTGTHAIASTGVAGSVLSGIGTGVYGETSSPDNNYGFYTPDNLYSSSLHLKGSTMQVVQNAGKEALEPGDVVVFSGILAAESALEDPVVLVSKAEEAGSTAIAGVVYSRYEAGLPDKARLPTGEAASAPGDLTPPGAAAPGDFLLVVIQGPARVKASAFSGPISTGDLLSSANLGGLASKATEVDMGEAKIPIPGTVLGKALEDLESGEKLIYVFVTIR